MTETKKLQVFLCHAAADKSRVRELYMTLQKRGLAPWLDSEDLLPGQDWRVEISKALLTSDVIIVCLSKNSVTKEGYVQKEINFALDKAQEKLDGAIFIIPAKLEKCDIPNRLSRYQWVDLQQSNSYEKLMSALKQRAKQLERLIVDDEVQSPKIAGKKMSFWLISVLLVIILTSLAIFATGQINIKSTLTPSIISIQATQVSSIDGMVLDYVSAGLFTMGSNNDEEGGKPVHQVMLDAFWIDETEVTNIMYAKCMQAGKCKSPQNTTSFLNMDYANHPVVSILWTDAVAYCSWAKRILPSEAQWEKAARGPKGNTYPWGNNPPDKDLLNYNLNIGGTTPVRSYPTGVSVYGAYDMAGNVWEWVNDLYSSDYYKISSFLNPLGPGSGKDRVLRGGSWKFENNDVHSAFRNYYFPSDTTNDIGFRCALSQ